MFRSRLLQDSGLYWRKEALDRIPELQTCLLLPVQYIQFRDGTLTRSKTFSFVPHFLIEYYQRTRLGSVLYNGGT